MLSESATSTCTTSTKLGRRRRKKKKKALAIGLPAIHLRHLQYRSGGACDLTVAAQVEVAPRLPAEVSGANCKQLKVILANNELYSRCNESRRRNGSFGALMFSA